MNVCFLLERGNPPRLNPILAELFDLLWERGVAVTVRYPEEELWRLDTLTADGLADLYLLKSDSELALSLAVALERLGARVVNRADACLRAKDKTLAAAILQCAGIPTPRSRVAAHPDRLAAAVAEGPLILKPNRGYHGAGIAVAETPLALPGADAYPELVFAQDYLGGARLDLKVFGIGEAVFGVRKPFAADSFLRAGAPAPLSPDIVDLARRCGRAFGLELYGLDIAEDADGPRVIDVNYFPGYRGVPGAARRLADYIGQVGGGEAA